MSRKSADFARTRTSQTCARSSQRSSVRTTCASLGAAGARPDETVLAVCRELELIHAVDPFVRPSLTPDLTYRRLHAWIDPKNETYVMFNNVPRGGDAKRFRAPSS